MKKFIFSAVALTAFVLPGFANDIAEKSSVVAVEENCSETYSQEVACLKREIKSLVTLKLENKLGQFIMSASKEIIMNANKKKLKLSKNYKF